MRAPAWLVAQMAASRNAPKPSTEEIKRQFKAVEKQSILDALKAGPMTLEALALKVGRAKEVVTVVVPDDFRDDIWDLIDKYKIQPGRTMAELELCK